MKKSKKPILRIVLVLVLIIVVGAAVAGTYTYAQLDKVKKTDISKSDTDLGINEDKTVKKEDKIVNIALFGVDSGGENREVAHTDTIMILTIDEVHKKLKLSSIMRDSYVEIDGHGSHKINAASVYGGPELAIKTINKNYNLDIRDYVTVDFFGLENIINALGGVEVDVKEKEIKEINKYGKQVADYKKEKYIPVKESGMQQLNGKQAVAYARIRKVGNSDFERTERQKTVLTALIEKIKNAGATKYPQIVSALAPNVETSLSNMDMITIGTDLFTSGINQIDWCRFPVDGYFEGKYINKAACLVFDVEATKDQINKYIYDDIKPVSKEPESK